MGHLEPWRAYVDPDSPSASTITTLFTSDLFCKKRARRVSFLSNSALEA